MTGEEQYRAGQGVDGGVDARPGVRHEEARDPGPAQGFAPAPRQQAFLGDADPLGPLLGQLDLVADVAEHAALLVGGLLVATAIHYTDNWLSVEDYAPETGLIPDNPWLVPVAWAHARRMAGTRRLGRSLRT